MTIARPALDRFFEKVEIGDCWLWTAGRSPKGYGQFYAKSAGRNYHPAHRWIWQELVGPIPNGLELDHLCRVRHCVNPDHLEPVTHAENVRRAPSNSATMRLRWAEWHAKTTHCKNGHEFTEENTMWYPNKRQCRTCNTEYARAWRAARTSEFAN